MTPVFQSVIDPVLGDCWAACLASILDAPLSETSRTANPKTWWVETFHLLRARDLWGVYWHRADGPAAAAVPKERHLIISGPSPRFSGVLHACVGEFDGAAFRVVHDPVKDGGGLAGDVVDAFWIIPLSQAVES